MAEVKWVKVSTSMFDSSRKIKQIELMPKGDTILVIWLKLLLLAGNINDGGAIYLTPEIPYTVEMLAKELRRPITTVKLALNIFEKFGMITIVDDIIKLSSWEKYQNVEGMEKIREQNRLRKQRQRQQTKPEMSRDCPVTVTQGHAIEEEIEEEREEDKEISFYLSSENDKNFYRKEAKLHLLNGSLGKGVVFISDEQLEDLMDKLSIEEFDHYVEAVADCILSGKRYKKTHYQAILDMVAADRKTK